MRISEAARRLGTSARMLRYREDLGLLPQVRDHRALGPGSSGPLRSGPLRSGPLRSGPLRSDPLGSGPLRSGRSGAGSFAAGASGAGSFAAGASGAGPRGPSHRQFGEADLEAVAAALELERRYDVSPAALAFGLRVLAEPQVRAAVADLGRRLGRIPAPVGRALDFEKERALRLLSGR